MNHHTVDKPRCLQHIQPSYSQTSSRSTVCKLAHKTKKKSYCEQIAHCLTFTSSFWQHDGWCLRCGTCMLTISSKLVKCSVIQGCSFHLCACADLYFLFWLFYYFTDYLFWTKTAIGNIVFSRNCYSIPSQERWNRWWTNRKKKKSDTCSNWGCICMYTPGEPTVGVQYMRSS